MPAYLAAIDQGTTGTRCILFDLEGRAAASAYREHEQILPRPGWVEHDPIEIRERVDEVVFEARRAAPAGQVLAVGITNQRETVVAWDASDGQPLSNAIVWQDTRTADECRAAIERGWEEDVRRRTGLPISTYFSATKMRWLLAHVPRVHPPRALGTAAPRHGGQLARLEPHGRRRGRRARHRPDERVPHAALRPRDPRVGPGSPRAVRRARERAAGDPALDRTRTLRLHLEGRTVRRARAGLRRARRSAGGALRAGLLRAGRGEEHLRHRLVPPRARRRPPAGERSWTPRHRRGIGAGGTRLRAGGIGRGVRVGRPVAAGQPRHHPRGRRHRGDRFQRAGHRRRVLRAGVLGPLRPSLGHARPRRRSWA